MGYRDDFYTAANMIGYSGKLSDFPTIYFQNGDEFGHITQKHGESQNVGRQAVAKEPGYVIENAPYQGATRLIERVGGQIFHVSRSTLKKIEEVPFEDQAIMLQAISKNPNEKYISSFSNADFDAIDLAADAKARALSEMLSKKK